MRPRSTRRLLGGLTGTAVLLTASSALAPAANASSLPAFAGVVRDACSGLAIWGASETLTPLAGQTPPNPIRLGGFFAYQTLPPGPYALSITAPGYQTIGIPSLSGVSDNPGVPIAIPTGPPILPSGDTVNSTLGADIRLQPGTTCSPTPPPILPALSGAIRDASTGQLISGATLTLTPLSGQAPQPPPIVPIGGLFAYPTLGSGSWGLSITAPGYQTIGTPSLTGISDNPGIPIATPTPPPILPAGDSTTLTQALDIQLTHT